MPKSKKTKAKHQDFQKVKLKVGKRLPKGLNETKATFKSTGINIKEQFKDEIAQPSNKRRLVLSVCITSSVIIYTCICTARSPGYVVHITYIFIIIILNLFNTIAHQITIYLLIH